MLIAACPTAEPQEHFRKDGAEEVQQVPQAPHSAQRDQVIVIHNGMAAIFNLRVASAAVQG